MKAMPPFVRGALPLIAAVLLLAGCAKEEGFAPCQRDQAHAAPGGAKSLAPEGNQEALQRKPADAVGTPDGFRISDDGDDVGDGERNRKKKPSS